MRTASPPLSFRIVALLCLIGILIMLPSFLSGPGATHSYIYNFLWVEHFGEQMAQGHLYERWLSDSFEGLGSPAFYFYPPFAYWIGGAFTLLGLPVLQAINAAGLLMLVASGLAMYHWLAWRGTRPLLGAILYMVAPYHLYEFYVRGALAEMATFIWLPLIALAIERLPDRRATLLLALCCAGLLFSHLPLALLTGLFVIAPMMLRRLRQDRSVLLPGMMAGLLAVGLAAIYLIPALTLQDHISTAMLWHEGYRATDWTVWTGSFLIFPCLAIGLILLALPAARSFWGVVAILAALGAINLIPLMWSIPTLDKLQFPWRLLCIAEFAAISAMVSARLHPVTLTAAAIALFPPSLLGVWLAQDMMHRPADYRALGRIAPDAPEYLPAGFDLSHVRLKDHWPDVSPWRTLPRGRSILVEKAGPVTLGHAAFPIWQVMHDGRPVPSRGPFIRFDAEPGLYKVERVRIWQEWVGATISLVSALLLAALALRRGPISDLSKFPAYSPSWK